MWVPRWLFGGRHVAGPAVSRHGSEQLVLMDECPGAAEVFAPRGLVGFPEEQLVSDAHPVPHEVGVGASGAGSDLECHASCGALASWCGQVAPVASAGGVVLLGLRLTA